MSLTPNRNEWEKFNCYFLELLDSTNPEGVVFFAFLHRILRQLQLEMLYTEAMVMKKLHEYADREIHQKGVTIAIPSAWVRKTVFSIVYQLSLDPLTPTSPSEITLSKSLPAAIFHRTLNRELAIVRQALKQLDPEDLNLLHLRIEELPQQGIQLTVTDEDFHLTSPTLRTRKAQALKRLRDLYYALQSLADLDL